MPSAHVSQAHSTHASRHATVSLPGLAGSGDRSGNDAGGGRASHEEPGIPPSVAAMLGSEDQYRTRQATYQRGAPVGAGQPTAASGARQIAVVLVTLLAAVPSVLLLYHSLFVGEGVSVSGAIGGTLMLIGLPMLAVGLSPVISGRSSAPSAWSALLRPPWVYLIVGLVLLLAAGLAAG